MSRRKRVLDEDNFEEYEVFDMEMRSDLRLRLEDVPEQDEDDGVDIGYHSRIGQSPRSPSVRGDDEFRPRRGRSPSLGDSDVLNDRVRKRRVVDDGVVDDDEGEFSRFSGRALTSAVKQKLKLRVHADGKFQVHFYTSDTDNVTFIARSLMGFPNIHRSIHSPYLIARTHVQLQNIALKGVVWINTNWKNNPAQQFPASTQVMFAVVYDRFYNNWVTPTDPGVQWSDVFKSSSLNASSGCPVGVDPTFFDPLNDENSARFRVMFRKVFPIIRRRDRPFLQFKMNGDITGTIGTDVVNLTIGPFLDGGAQIDQTGEATTTDHLEHDAVYIEEFINLCNLPSKVTFGDPDISVANGVPQVGGLFFICRAWSNIIGVVPPVADFDQYIPRGYFQYRVNADTVDV